MIDAPIRGNPLEFVDETYPAKTRGIGLAYGENFNSNFCSRTHRLATIHNVTDDDRQTTDDDDKRNTTNSATVSRVG